MACLWARDQNAEWVAYLLEGKEGLYTLCNNPGRPVQVVRNENVDPLSTVLMRSETATGPGKTWALVCGPEEPVRINGRRMVSGLRTLRDRDEIRTPTLGTLFFTEDTRPVVQALPGLGSELECPRCKQGIPEGSPAVRCPNCGTWHHQAEGTGEDGDLPCWTYSDHCSVCGHSTDLNGGFRWTPEGL